MRKEKKNGKMRAEAVRGLIAAAFLLSLFCVVFIFPHELSVASEAEGSFSPMVYVKTWPFEPLDAPLEDLRNEALGLIFSSCKEAVAAFRRLETETEDLYGLEDPRTLGVKIRLVYSYNQCGDLKEAIDLGTDILGLSESVLGEDSLEPILLKNRLADSHLKSGNLMQARDLYVNVMTGLGKMFGEEDLASIDAKEDLAFAFLKLKDYSHARYIYAKLLEIRERKFGTDEEKSLELKANLGLVDFYLGRRDLGLKLINESLESARRVLGEDSLTTKIIEDHLNAINLILEKGEDN
jgi:tetratricopeptide (TPR) repeat protein